MTSSVIADIISRSPDLFSGVTDLQEKIELILGGDAGNGVVSEQAERLARNVASALSERELGRVSAGLWPRYKLLKIGSGYFLVGMGHQASGPDWEGRLAKFRAATRVRELISRLHWRSFESVSNCLVGHALKADIIDTPPSGDFGIDGYGNWILKLGTVSQQSTILVQSKYYDSEAYLSPSNIRDFAQACSSFMANAAPNPFTGVPVVQGPVVKVLTTTALISSETRNLATALGIVLIDGDLFPEFAHLVDPGNTCFDAVLDCHVEDGAGEN